MRTSRFLLPLVLLALLAACSDPFDPQAPEPNDFPPRVILEASRLTGEAAFDVTFQANASDQDANRLTYAWHVNGEQVADALSPTLTITFYEAGSYEVTVLVSDGLHEVSARVTVTATNDYRPSEAPDVAIIGFAGRCGIFPKCSAPAQNRAYLSEDPGTLQAIERTFHQLGHTTMAFSFRSHLHDSATYGPGYRSADALLEFVRDEWIRDFRNPTRVVLVAHSHGNQFMSLLAWDHPEIEFAYGLYLDAVCALWDGDHIRTGQFSDAYGHQENFPRPLNILGAACDSLYVPGVGQEDISDVVPWNVWWSIEVASNGIGLPSAVADDDPNHRPNGTSGNAVGLTGIFQTDEGHLDIHRHDSKALNWVLDTIARNGLPTLGLTPQAVTRDLLTPPAPQGFRLNH